MNGAASSGSAGTLSFFAQLADAVAVGLTILVGNPVFSATGTALVHCARGVVGRVGPVPRHVSSEERGARSEVVVRRPGFVRRRERDAGGRR